MRYLAELPRAGCSLRRRGKDIASGYRPTLVEGAVSSSYNSFSFPSMSFHVQYHDIISLVPWLAITTCGLVSANGVAHQLPDVCLSTDC
jgi:hypothetical protein